VKFNVRWNLWILVHFWANKRWSFQPMYSIAMCTVPFSGDSNPQNSSWLFAVTQSLAVYTRAASCQQQSMLRGSSRHDRSYSIAAWTTLAWHPSRQSWTTVTWHQPRAMLRLMADSVSERNDCDAAVSYAELCTLTYYCQQQCSAVPTLFS